MTTVILDYPGLDVSFVTLKRFKTNKDRTTYLHAYLDKYGIEIPYHHTGDMIVEEVETYRKTETWILGS